jgi:regulator of sigma E protease
MRDFGMVMSLGPITAVQKSSPATSAGLEVGDRIVSINGEPVGDPITLENRLRRMATAGKSASLKIERKVDGKPETKTVDVSLQVPTFTDGLMTISPLPLSPLGITCEVSPIVAAVKPGSPAAAGDLRAGDEVVSAKLLSPAKPSNSDLFEDESAPPSQTVTFGKRLSWPGFVLDVLPTLDPATEIEFVLKRGDATQTVKLAMSELKDSAGNVVHSPQRGFNFEPTTYIHQAQSFRDAIQCGARETVDSLTMVFRFLKRLGSGKIPVTMISGPFGIIQAAGFEAEQGFSKLLLFLTLLSANLAVVNFLPIPVLDGGHMVFLLYEGLRGKPASERVIVGFTYAGMIFLLSLMLFVLALDTGLISRL